jgi:hypothetical protein|tara:strand:- start:825 stop:1037 length:213 start_codon:yes stop_codon:yes gene_type:complete
MKIDIKDYIVENKKSKKAALKDMGISSEIETYRDGYGFFPGENDNSYDGETESNEDYEDIADCGDEWYID